MAHFAYFGLLLVTNCTFVCCFSISAAKTGHRVFAFEPNKETWKYLQGSIEVNHLQSDVSLFQHALLDKRQPCAVFTTPDRANQGHTIVEGANDPIICEKDINVS